MAFDPDLLAPLRGDPATAEPKGLSVTCRYRANPALEPRVTAWPGRWRRRQDWSRGPGRKSVELLPPVRADKGTVIRHWAAGLRAACYLGDDHGHLAAFAALGQLAARGIAAARIAVRSDEAPAELCRSRT